MNTDTKIRLRALEPEDLELLYAIENDVSLWGVGITNVPYSRYTLHDYIANASNDIYVDRQVRLIVENEEGQTVGIVDVVNFDPQHHLGCCQRTGRLCSAHTPFASNLRFCGHSQRSSQKSL